MLIRLVPAVLASLALLAGVAYAAGQQDVASALLPDLDQEAPTNLVVTHEAGEYRLGFRSAVRNVGDGPLKISGSRRDGSLETMVADQIVDHRDGPRKLVRGVGRLRYTVSPDHRHWHLLGFEHYELLRPDGGTAPVRDRKTGFCLGDRYEVHDRVLAAKAPTKRYRSRCGLGQPERLGITEGISVGYGDAYSALLEGQYVPLTGLPDGRYVLVHRVNAERRLRELDYTNNAASSLLELRWSDGVPRIRVLAVCADSERCDQRA